MVSTKCTITSAAVSRTDRYVVTVAARNQRTSSSRRGKPARQASPSLRSRVSSRTAVPTMVSSAVTRPSKPLLSSSWIASTSLVRRLTTRPEV